MAESFFFQLTGLRSCGPTFKKRKLRIPLWYRTSILLPYEASTGRRLGVVFLSETNPRTSLSPIQLMARVSSLRQSIAGFSVAYVGKNQLRIWKIKSSPTDRKGGITTLSVVAPPCARFAVFMKEWLYVPVKKAASPGPA